MKPAGKTVSAFFFQTNYITFWLQMVMHYADITSCPTAVQAETSPGQKWPLFAVRKHAALFLKSVFYINNYNNSLQQSRM